MEASRVLDTAVQDEEFEQFYRRYAQHVYRYSLAVLRNPADAEDITQTTFLNAYRAMRQGERPRKPHNWLIKIAHNACRSRYLRLARRPKEVPFDESVEQLAVPPDERPNVKAVLDALGTLPFNQRAALVMRELEGRSYAEIATMLDVSVPAVEMLIFRARKGMRKREGSLRALGAVQLPATLASWLEGGGAIAGGSAVVGTGLAVKAALALTAAAVVAGGVKETALRGTPVREPTPVASVSSPSGNSVAGGTARIMRRGKQVVVIRAAPNRRGAAPHVQAGAAEEPSTVAPGPAAAEQPSSSDSPSQTSSPSPTEAVAQTVSTASTPSVPGVSPPSVPLPVTLPPTPELPPPPALPPPPNLP